MKSMLYYPGFEVEDVKWLKFALLYFEELRPIIPYISAPEYLYLSENAIRIMNETNLIRPYCPDYEEGRCASIIACKEFDQYFHNPERYSYLFTGNHNINMMDKWTNPYNQTCNLYDGKFSNEFYEYCIKNGIATPFSNGIKISKDLAFIYMSFLADVISKNLEYEMFTDINKYNTLLLKHDQKLMNAQKFHYKIAKTQIEFSVPVEIDKIPLERIIRLRSDPNFDNYRRAYVEEIQKYLNIREINPNATFDDQLKIRKEILRILELSFGTVTSLYLTASSISSIMNDNISPTLALATAYTNATALKNLCNAPEYLEQLKIKVQAKRYLGQIRKISAPYICKRYNCM